MKNWLKPCGRQQHNIRDTVEFLGIWEIISNPKFNRVQFEAVKKDTAGLANNPPLTEIITQTQTG